MAKKIAIGAGVAVLLVAIGVSGLTTNISSEKRDAQGYALAALSDVAEDWNAQKLLSRTSADFQSSHSAAQIERDFALMKSDLGALRSAEPAAWNIEKNSSGKRAFVELAAHFENKDKAVRLWLVHSNGSWQISDFRVVR